MIDELVGGCLSEIGHWILGVVFLLAALVVLLRLPSSEQVAFSSLLAGLLLHSSAMLIVGFGLGKAKRSLVISWFVLLVVFFALAALLHWRAGRRRRLRRLIRAAGSGRRVRGRAGRSAPTGSRVRLRARSRIPTPAAGGPPPAAWRVAGSSGITGPTGRGGGQQAAGRGIGPVPENRPGEGLARAQR